MTSGYRNSIGRAPTSYAQAVAQTDACEAQMRDDEDRKTPEGRERIRLRLEASAREIATRTWTK